VQKKFIISVSQRGKSKTVISPWWGNGRKDVETFARALLRGRWAANHRAGIGADGLEPLGGQILCAPLGGPRQPADCGAGGPPYARRGGLKAVRRRAGARRGPAGLPMPGATLNSPASLGEETRQQRPIAEPNSSMPGGIGAPGSASRGPAVVGRHRLIGDGAQGPIGGRLLQRVAGRPAGF
jgi:hypothetical protein